MDMQVVDVETENKLYINIIMKHVQVQTGYTIVIINGYWRLVLSIAALCVMSLEAAMCSTAMQLIPMVLAQSYIYHLV